MHTMRKYQDGPYRTLDYPEHGQKTSVNVLVDQSIDPNMRNFTVTCARIEPGGYSVPHKHTYEKAIFYLSGDGLVQIGDEEHKVSPRTMVFIPADTVHCHKEVIGDEPLVLLEISVPPIDRAFVEKLR